MGSDDVETALGISHEHPYCAVGHCLLQMLGLNLVLDRRFKHGKLRYALRILESGPFALPLEF